MTKFVSIIDYGVGNLLSVYRALCECKANVKIVTTPEEVLKSDRIILPGVGAYGKCMEELKKRNLEHSVIEFIKKGNPMLGICVGMQILHDFGEEFGHHNGLGIIPGKVSRIPSIHSSGTHKIPFIGWAGINPIHPSAKETKSILADIKPGTFFYFVHSFMGIPKNPDHIFATYNYNGISIPAIVGKDNVVGCQFHPEKSGGAGLNLLNNFLLFDEKIGE